MLFFSAITEEGVQNLDVENNGKTFPKRKSLKNKEVYAEKEEEKPENVYYNEVDVKSKQDTYDWEKPYF